MGYDRSDYRDKWRIERLAASTRERIGLDQYAVLDPRALLDLVNARLLRIGDLVRDQADLRRMRAVAFDGATFMHPDEGRPGILLNCGKPPRRQTATLMEEIAHLLLGHQPTRVTLKPGVGIPARTYDAESEKEAYDLGSATLLPKERIQQDVKDRQHLASTIADAHDCSEDLVNYRIRRLRLWQRYQRYATEAA